MRLPRPALLAAIAALLAAIVGLVLPGTASAHTGFESSSPADGSVVDTPVDIVTVAFTGEATPVGDQFIALTSAGELQEPVSIETVDNVNFTIRFDPPLAGGVTGLRWNVQAADSHPIEGAFSFTVDATVPTTTAPTTTPPPITTVPSTTVSSTAPASTTAPDATVTASSSTTEPGVSSTTEPAIAIAGDVVPPAEEASAVRPAPSLEEFLAVDNSRPGQTTATIGRVIGFLGVAVGLGALGFLAFVLRGRRDEVRRSLVGVRVLGVAIAIGAAIEYVGVGKVTDEAIGSTWSTAPGFATVLRMVGGLGLALGLAATIDRTSSVRSLSAATVEDRPTGMDSADVAPAVRWKPTGRSWPGFLGVAMIVASFWFDGHTVSKGFRPLHALVNTVHIVAGALWVGGVVMIAVVAWARHRAGRPTRGIELVVRFSTIATVSLAAVAIAGGVMAILVLDSFGELTGTPWGKILLLKTSAVGLAVVAGAYNHFRLLPRLENDPESPEHLAVLRSSITAEAIMLVFVVTVTAWLVSAAS